MPSGYTYKVNDGTMTSAKEFLLDFVKRYGMGYLLTRQGELAMPKKYSPDLAMKAVGDYHTKQLDLAIKDLQSFEKLSDKELRKRYAKYFCEKTAYNKQVAEEKSTIKTRYLNMIEKVNKWLAPSGLQEMKDSAIKALQESMDFDCCSYPDDVLTFDDWLKKEREHLVWTVNYHTEEKKKEDDRRAEMDVMLKAFYESIENLD